MLRQLTAYWNEMNVELFDLYASPRLPRERIGRFLDLDRGILDRKRPRHVLTDWEVNRRTDEMENWLRDLQVKDVRRIAPYLVVMGFERATLEPIVQDVGNDVAKVVGRLGMTCGIASALANIELAARHISEISEAIKVFTRPTAGPRQPLRVEDSLGKAIELSCRKLGDIEVVRQFAPALPLVDGQPDGLLQVWLNLVNNAVEAMKGRGSLTLRTRRDPRRGGVVVEIEDDGPGIPGQFQAKLFQPFFTTKPPNVGTGLGLSTSERIIRDHRGEIGFESVPGRTSFHVWLPASTGGSAP